MADQAEEPTAAVAVERAGESHQPTAVDPSRSRRPRTVGAAVLALLVGLTIWAGWRDVQARRDQAEREQMVAAGRAGVLALTTIDHTEVDRDVQRILDASTGAFRDDFASRAEPFKAAARAAQSTSVGTVRESGLESVDGETAQVLVALTVMTSNRGESEQQPKSWRTRVTVTRADDGYKVAAVEFVQ